MKNKRQWILGVFVVALIGLVPSAGAVTIDVDLSGDFDFHNEVFTVDFSLDSDRVVSFFTSSWVTGGFDTAIFLWDATGNWLGLASGYNDDANIAGSASSNGTSYSYGEYDAFMSRFLGAGDYTATVVHTGNVPVDFPGIGNLSSGFSWDNAAPVAISNGHYEFHMVGISDYSIPGSSPIPEPATVTLLALGGSLLAMRRRRLT